MEDRSGPSLHIELYRQLLEVEFDPDRREIVARLMKEAEADLRKSSEATAEHEFSHEASQREAGEEKARLAGSPTAAAETFFDRERRAEMSDEEKLQQRTDDQAARSP